MKVKILKTNKWAIPGKPHMPQVFAMVGQEKIVPEALGELMVSMKYAVEIKDEPHEKMLYEDKKINPVAETKSQAEVQEDDLSKALEEFSEDEIIDFALHNYKLKLDKRKSKKSMIEAIQAHLNKGAK